MIVVDTNVIAYLYIPGLHTPAAQTLRESDSHWTAPPLWRSELRNVLAGYIRRNLLSFEEACGVQQQAEALLAGFEGQVQSRIVLELVRDSSCTAYDCEFIALARQLGTKLVTMNAKLLRAFPDDAVALTIAIAQ